MTPPRPVLRPAGQKATVQFGRQSKVQRGLGGERIRVLEENTIKVEKWKEKILFFKFFSHRRDPLPVLWPVHEPLGPVLPPPGHGGLWAGSPGQAGHGHVVAGPGAVRVHAHLG